MERYDYLRPSTLEEALGFLQDSPAPRLLAGGTDLMVQLDHGRIEPPKTVISLRSVAELQEVQVGDETRIGAAVPLGDLLRHPELGTRYPALRQALHVFASPQIRNVATLGGNLCNASPAADSAPPLLVYEARVELASSTGRRELPLAEFFTGPGQTALTPGEIVVAIHLPPTAPDTKSTFARKGRVQMDLAIVSAAVLLVLDKKTCTKIRIAVGAVAPTPLRLKEVERLVLGQEINEALITEVKTLVREQIAPITDLRASADYRRTLTATLVGRGLQELG